MRSRSGYGPYELSAIHVFGLRVANAAHQMNLPGIPGVIQLCLYLELNRHNLSQEMRNGKKKRSSVVLR